MRMTWCIASLVGFGLAFLARLHATAAPLDTETQQIHWAFQPVQRPEPPLVSDPDWSRNPIDRFVRARLEAGGSRPARAVDRRTLIRRLSLDLIGLPPSPEVVQAFLEDTSTDAVAHVVDDLLARPQFGERWARHWMDIVRYADTNGYERDGAKPHAWRYRDWVIDALNRDKPYDQFLIEQLAGDEIEGSDARAQIATTFLRLGTWDDEPAEPMVDRHDQLDDVLGTTATAFLGLTLRCARCHDHKFEPFSQLDYYRMLAVFQPLKRPQFDRDDLDRPVGTESELAADHASRALAEAEIGRVWERIEGLIRPEIVRRLAPSEKSKDGKPATKQTSLTPDAISAFLAEPTKRTQGQRDLVKQFAGKLEAEVRRVAPQAMLAAIQPLDDRIAAIKAALPKELPRAYIWYEDGPKAPPTHVLKRGDPARPGIAVEPGVPAILAAQPPGSPRPTARSTGRRIWLARLLTRPENPLVARVIVNRIWQFHFGEGLVASANDFGVMGDRPSHPELLDWLAAELVRSGWRLKPLHRIIVLSRTYQQSSAVPSGAADVDSQGPLFGRWRQRRLDAEVVRDSILAVSGRLNTRMGGRGVYPALPRAVLEGQSRPGEGWGRSDDREQCRRSVYLFVKRSLRIPELDLLDAPESTSSCERRIVSTTGPQALTFLNGAFIHEQARHFASRLVAEAGPDANDQVERAFALALARPPRPEELRAAREFLDEQQQQIRRDDARSQAGPGEARRKALEAFSLVVLNMNEFFYHN